MTAKQRSQEVKFIDCILSVLNKVEQLRERACEDFYVYGDKAREVWCTAGAMEDALIRECNLPDLDEILSRLVSAAESGMGFTGGPIVKSYMKIAFALWQVDYILRQTLTPKLRLMLDIIRADGFDGEYCPAEQMIGTCATAASTPSKIEGVAEGRGSMTAGRDDTPSPLRGTPPNLGGEFHGREGGAQ